MSSLQAVGPDGHQPTSRLMWRIPASASASGNGDFGLGGRRRRWCLLRLIGRGRRPVLHLEQCRRRAPFRRHRSWLLAAAVRVIHVPAGDGEPYGRRRRRHCHDLYDRLLVGVLVQLVTREEASHHDLPCHNGKGTSGFCTLQSTIVS